MKTPMRSLITLIVIAAFAASSLVRAADPTYASKYFPSSPSPTAAASPAKKQSQNSKAAAAETATPAAASNSAATPAAMPMAKKYKAPEPQAAQAAGGGNGQVWVNTETHVFHKEGSKWYGKTKQGKYMSEAEAVKEGDKAAKNEKQ
jgi:hypothetical protein